MFTKIHSKKFDKDNQKHCEIVMHAVMKALDSSHEAKIVRISEMLSQALGNPEELRRAEDFINIISELSENEAICFGEIYREFAVHPSDDNDAGKDLKNYGENVIKNMERDDRVYLLGRLAGKGLIRERTMGTWDSLAVIFTRRIWERNYIEPSRQRIRLSESVRKSRGMYLSCGFILTI